MNPKPTRTKLTRAKKTAVFSAAEMAAHREAKDAHRTGLPVTAKTRRLLASALRKRNLHRYGKADALPLPAAVIEHGAAHYH